MNKVTPDYDLLGSIGTSAMIALINSASIYTCTHIRKVKPPYRDHSAGQTRVVTVDRWPL